MDWLYCAMTTRHVIDPQGSRLELAERLPGLAGFDAHTPIVVGEQVHGNKTACVSEESDKGKDDRGGSSVEVPSAAESEEDGVFDPDAMLLDLDDQNTISEIPGVDGLLTCDAGVLLAVFTADCVPIVLADPVRRSAAVIHAGREGTFQRIASEAVAHLRKKGWAEPQDIVAWIGPSICQAHYEVSPDMAAAFSKRFFKYPKAVNNRRLDLREINRRLLMEAGLKAKSIETDPRCTFEEEGLFYSHRREGGLRGRMATFIYIIES